MTRDEIQFTGRTRYLLPSTHGSKNRRRESMGSGTMDRQSTAAHPTNFATFTAGLWL